MATLLRAALVFALVACSGPGTPPRPTTPGQSRATPGRTPTRPPPPGPARPLSFAACQAAPCMLHAGRARYHQCLHAAGGQCFHYGAPCEPTDQCMLDPAGQYRKCQRARSGECLDFGPACEPAGRCMVDPRDGLSRTCEQVTDGRCQRFGAACSPG
jgi:hypothetical protein